MGKQVTITAAAMSRAIEAAKQGVRIEVRPDGTVILEPKIAPDERTQPADIVDWRRRK